MSVRPRLHACRRTPAPVGAPVHGSLHGPCIDLKPGVLLPTPTPTDSGEDGGETLGAMLKKQGMKIVDAGREQWKEQTVYDQASRQMFDMIDEGSWFTDMVPGYREQKRKDFVEYVEQKASKGFVKLQKADALAPLQNRRRRLSENYRQVGDYSQERANKFYKQDREFLVLEGLIELVYKMVDKKEKRENYTNELSRATSDVQFREERFAIAKKNLHDERERRDKWKRANEAIEKQLKKLTSDLDYITAHDLYDLDVVHHPQDAITQALDETAPPLANDESKAPEGEDWAMKRARKARKEYELTRRERGLPPLPSDYMRARDLREAQNRVAPFAPGLTPAEKKAEAKELKKSGALDGNWAEQLARAEREAEEKEKGANYDEQTAAQMDERRAQELRQEMEKLLRGEEEEEEDSCDEGEEYSKKNGTPCPKNENLSSSKVGDRIKSAMAAAINSANWKPLPQVLGAEWDGAGWGNYEINEEQTMARSPLENGDYAYYTAIKNDAGMITDFKVFKDDDLSV